jgi:1-acyl-sn-glycerol-3-phosphate acyltransferase
MKSVRVIYGVYVWLMFAAIWLCATLLMLLLPGVERRRRLARAGARAILKLAGMCLVVKGEEFIPAGQCVIVANHASYLDGLVFTAALPPRFSFVIKREMSRVPLAGLLLRRLGSQFVERSNRNRSAADARRVMRTAVNGESLVFFPEGTFSLQPGLLKFHTGAFVTAARTGCPVVPAVVRGTRKALAPKSAWPQPSRIEVEILPPLAPVAQTRTVELRDRARAAILTELREPDLSVA